MAKLETIIPHILKWEAGADPSGRSSNASKQKWFDSIREVYSRAKQSGSWSPELTRELFNITRTRGYVNDPHDSGGHTMCGLTLGTFESFRRKKGRSKPTVDDLKNISYDEWHEVLQTMFWDRFKADQIRNQSIACLCVDWFWNSGTYAIKNTQQCLNLLNDGIVGQKTLAALNAKDSATVFRKIFKKRRNYYYALAAKKESNKRYLTGWLNRLNDTVYEAE